MPSPLAQPLSPSSAAYDLAQLLITTDAARIKHALNCRCTPLQQTVLVLLLQKVLQGHALCGSAQAVLLEAVRLIQNCLLISPDCPLRGPSVSARKRQLKALSVQKVCRRVFTNRHRLATEWQELQLLQTCSASAPPTPLSLAPATVQSSAGVSRALYKCSPH